MPTQEQYNVTLQSTQKLFTKVNILNNLFQVIGEIDGVVTETPSFTNDENSDIRRTASITLEAIDSTFDISQGNKIWLDRYIQIFIGIKYEQTDEIIYTNMGIYTIDNPHRVYDSKQNTMNFQCLDLMANLNGIRNGYLDAGYEIKAGQNIRDLIIATIVKGGFSKYVVEECDYDVPNDISVPVGSTYYDILKELVNINPNYQIYFDVDGIFHYKKIPTESNNQMTIADDNIFSNTMISYEVNTDFENFANSVLVYGHTWDTQCYVENPSYEKNKSGIYRLVMDISSQVNHLMDFSQNVAYSFRDKDLGLHRYKINTLDTIPTTRGSESNSVMPYVTSTQYANDDGSGVDRDPDGDKCYVVSVKHKGNEEYHSPLNTTVSGVNLRFFSDKYFDYYKDRYQEELKPSYKIIQDENSGRYIFKFINPISIPISFKTPNVDFSKNPISSVKITYDAQQDLCCTSLGYSSLNIDFCAMATYYNNNLTISPLWYYTTNAKNTYNSAYSPYKGNPDFIVRTHYSENINTQYVTLQHRYYQLDGIDNKMPTSTKIIPITDGFGNPVSIDKSNTVYVGNLTITGYETYGDNHEMYGTFELLTKEGFTAFGQADDTNTDSPYYVEGTVGNVKTVLCDGNYENLYSYSQAQACAEYELYKRCRLQDSVTINCVPMYWLDVNDLVELTLPNKQGTEETHKYLIKSISTQKTQTISLMRIYE